MYSYFFQFYNLNVLFFVFNFLTICLKRKIYKKKCTFEKQVFRLKIIRAKTNQPLEILKTNEKRKNLYTYYKIRTRIKHF